MIGSLAQGLVGVIVDEVAAQGGRRIQQQRDGVAPYQQHQQQYQQQYQQQRQQQQQLPPGPLASLVESITLLFNRAVAAVVAVRTGVTSNRHKPAHAVARCLVIQIKSRYVRMPWPVAVGWYIRSTSTLLGLMSGYRGPNTTRAVLYGDGGVEK